MTKAQFDSDFEAQLSKAFSEIEAFIDQKRIPGAVLGLVDLQQGRLTRAVGAAQTVPHHRAMTTETWFDLASLTKVIFTTTQILELAAKGVIDLDAPLTTVLPDLRQYDSQAWERQVTFRACLGHLTAFPAVEPIYTYGHDPELLRAFVLQREWRRSAPVYSDINFILLGFALERVFGKRVRDLDPGKGFAFSAPADQSAATENCVWRHRVMCGEVHDENCYALQGSGHAGLFGTVTSVLDFAEAVLRGDGFASSTLEAIRAPLSEKRTHGWERAYSGWSGGSTCSSETIGHTGFTGTGLWIDFTHQRAWTLLTNRVHPSRHSDSGIVALRRTVGDAINRI
jgi:CubicO group peptidase (beta-lactamase class C family)